MFHQFPKRNRRGSDLYRESQAKTELDLFLRQIAIQKKVMQNLYLPQPDPLPKSIERPQVFFSYAWEEESPRFFQLQTFLRRMAADFEMAGVEPWLDLLKLVGNIEHEMRAGVNDSNLVILMGTHTYAKKTVPESPSNVKKELDFSLQKNDPNFSLIPLLLEGKGKEIFPTLGNDFLRYDASWLDLSAQPVQEPTRDYIRDMGGYIRILTSLENPVGLLPVALGLHKANYLEYRHAFKEIYSVLQKSLMSRIESFYSVPPSVGLPGNSGGAGDDNRRLLKASSARNEEKDSETEDQKLKESQKIETPQVISELVQKAEQINAENLQVQGIAGRDVISVTNGVRGSGAVDIGGGNVGVAAAGQESLVDEEAEVVEVLKRLKAFFRDEEYEGEKSPDFERYNMALSSYQAELGYNKKQQKHTLYVNDKALSSQDSMKAITKMLTISAAAGAVPMPVLADRGASRGNLQQQGKAGRDVIGITGGVLGGNVRIGGGDVITHAYDGQRVHHNNAPKFNFEGQSLEGNIMQGENQVQHNNGISR